MAQYTVTLEIQTPAGHSPQPGEIAILLLEQLEGFQSVDTHGLEPILVNILGVKDG